MPDPPRSRTLEDILSKLTPNERKAAERLKEVAKKISNEIPDLSWAGERVTPIATTANGKSIIARGTGDQIHLIPITNKVQSEVASLLLRKRTIEHNMVRMLEGYLRE